jgi:hypothetical protein
VAQARYTIFIPKTGLQGEALPDIAQAAHHYLSLGHAPVENTYIDRDRHGTFGGHTGPHDLVVMHGEDTPETDGHVKQLATFVGDLTRHPVTHATKDSKGGVNHWTIRTLTANV